MHMYIYIFVHIFVNNDTRVTRCSAALRDLLEELRASRELLLDSSFWATAFS